MKRPQLEVADIFRNYETQYKQRYPMTPEQRKVMAAIIACRTSQLGGHIEVCDNCGSQQISYNSCRNRHCPKCQTMTKERWLQQRKAELLPCGYFHVVFTVPHVLNHLILANKKELLALLFTAAKETLVTFAADPQWRLEGKPGFMAILHTWSQTLIDHFHLHCLIPAGVLSFDGRKWIKAREKYLFRVESLAKEFRKRYLKGIDEFLKTEKMVPFFGNDLSTIKREARKKDWIVYAKKPFAGPEQVLEYLGRYTHRIAISNHRIKEIENDKVTFSYRDRADNNSKKTITLDACEFIRRFLLHVLPDRFMKIRYFGFLANCNRKKSVLWISRLLGKELKFIDQPKESIEKMMLRLTGIDITLCPHCKIGKMVMDQSIPKVNSS